MCGRLLQAISTLPEASAVEIEAWKPFFELPRAQVRSAVFGERGRRGRHKHCAVWLHEDLVAGVPSCSSRGCTPVAPVPPPPPPPVPQLH
jgi:hypothetical protein